MKYTLNKFNEVVPVNNGRISNDTTTYRDLTDFEEELLEEIKELRLENDNLQRELDELKYMYNGLCK